MKGKTLITIIYTLSLITMISWIAAMIMQAITFLGIPLPSVTFSVRNSLLIFTLFCTPVSLMVLCSLKKVEKYAPSAEGHELLGLLKRDILGCFEAGVFLLIRVGLMSLAPITIVTALFPLDSFKALLSLCIMVSVPVAAFIALSDYESMEDPPEKFIDRFGKELHVWVPFGKHIASKIDPHDMRLIASPIIAVMAMIMSAIYVYVFTICPYLNIRPSPHLLLLIMVVIPAAILVMLYRRNLRKVKSEKVRKQFTAILTIYAMMTLSPTVSLLVRYHVIEIPTLFKLGSLEMLVIATILYFLWYFAATNYLRCVGLITEKLPTTNKENQKT